MLIFEGPDLVGKTTFAKSFLNELPRHIYRHFGLLPPAFDHFRDYDQHSGVYIIQDRFHMSELVYGTVCRDNCQVNPERYRLINGMLALKGAMTIVMCFEEPALLKERYSRHVKREAFDEGQCLAVNSAYFDIENYFSDYDVQYDYFLTFNRDKPFATDRDREIILDAYIQRLEEVFKV